MSKFMPIKKVIYSNKDKFLTQTKHINYQKLAQQQKEKPKKLTSIKGIGFVANIFLRKISGLNSFVVKFYQNLKMKRYQSFANSLRL